MAAKAKPYDHLKTVPAPAEKIGTKKKKPKLMAVVDEDNCTGCEACIPFCPVDCIEHISGEKYRNHPISPVQIRFHECIGCQICAKVCTQLTWDAIRMIPTVQFEKDYGIKITDDKTGEIPWDKQSETPAQQTKKEDTSKNSGDTADKGE